MDLVDLSKTMDLVRSAAIKGFTDQSQGFLSPKFQIELKSYLQTVPGKLSATGATLAVIRAYEAGKEFYKEEYSKG